MEISVTTKSNVKNINESGMARLEMLCSRKINPDGAAKLY